MATYRITLTRSLIGCSGTQRRTAAALGLRKPNQTVELKDSAGLQGQLDKVRHLLRITEINEG
jgi:large subunit ribosomal protein L30